MMNPTLTTNDNVTYLVNELLSSGGSASTSDVLRDMILTMSVSSVKEAVLIYSRIGFQAADSHRSVESVVETILDMENEHEPSYVNHRASFAVRFINASPITFDQLFGEMKELIFADSLENFKEEVSDVLYMGYCLLFQKTGIDLKMYGARSSTRKFISRMKEWKQIFNMWGIEFSKDYLVGGSNHKKASKVEAAYKLACANQAQQT